MSMTTKTIRGDGTRNTAKRNIGELTAVRGLIKGALNCIEITGNYDGAIWRLADAAGLLAQKTNNEMEHPTGLGFQVVHTKRVEA